MGHQLPSSLRGSTGKVTQGLPSLMPEVRQRADEFNYKRDYQKALFNDSEARRLAAIASDAGRPTTSKEAQEGIPLTSGQVLKRLLKCVNPGYQLHMEVALADSSKVGIYMLDPLAEGGRRFLMGMEAGSMPEFSVRKTDAEGNFSGEIRGWRTVLAKLIRGRIISKTSADALFGPPNRDSANWQTMTA